MLIEIPDGLVLAAMEAVHGSPDEKTAVATVLMSGLLLRESLRVRPEATIREVFDAINEFAALYGTTKAQGGNALMN